MNTLRQDAEAQTMKRITRNTERTVRPRFDNEEYYAWLVERVDVKGRPATDDEVRDYINQWGSKNAVNLMRHYLEIARMIRKIWDDNVKLKSQ